jgi:branched-chain amino acid aminotransferase
MGFTPTEKIWFNGNLVAWDQARVHVLAHGLHYGTGVFEGLRSYQTEDGPAVFRLDTHLDRLFDSAAVYELAIPYSREMLMEATLDVVRHNGLRDAYLRPIAFFDVATLTVWANECPVSVAIAGFPYGSYLAGGPGRGVRVTLSSIGKIPSNAVPATAKACGQYLNSVRAIQEAQRKGFDEAILLNHRGEISEGTGENLFLVKNGLLRTNGAEADILMGVTRATVLELAHDLEIPTEVGAISVEDLFSADELFFSGTAAEVTPIVELDGRQIGDAKTGPFTRRIQESFFGAARGKLPRYRKWLSPVRQPKSISCQDEHAQSFETRG